MAVVKPVRGLTACVSGARARCWQSTTLLHARPLHAQTV